MVLKKSLDVMERQSPVNEVAHLRALGVLLRTGMPVAAVLPYRELQSALSRGCQRPLACFYSICYIVIIDLNSLTFLLVLDSFCLLLKASKAKQSWVPLSGQQVDGASAQVSSGPAQLSLPSLLEMLGRHLHLSLSLFLLFLFFIFKSSFEGWSQEKDWKAQGGAHFLSLACGHFLQR